MGKTVFKGLTREERYNTLYNVCESFVEHSSAFFADIIDGKVNPRQEFEDLFDFEEVKLREDVYEKAKETLLEKVLSINPAFTIDSVIRPEESDDTLKDYIEVWINRFVKNIKGRCFTGIVTWEEFKNHLHNVDLQNSPFGIRVQRFGKTYSEVYFNYIVDSGDVVKLYKAEWQEDSEDEAIIDTASFDTFSNKDIEEIWIGGTDFVYQCGLRDAHIKYNNGETVFFRFSEEN